MDTWYYLPMIFWCLCVFTSGLVVGSFLNVLIARLPYEKSILWPSSRCFSCYQPIRSLDNLPIVGYLFLRGKCRNCGTKFSPGYLGVEIATGVLFLGLFIIEVLTQGKGGPFVMKPWQYTPGLEFSLAGLSAMPPWNGVIHWAIHAFLISWLLAASVIDAKHQIIPTQISYTGVLVGLIVSTLFPWPWPTTDARVLSQIPTNLSWILPEAIDKIPTGLMPWPFWGPTPSWAPMGSGQLGLMSSLFGALFGMMLVRSIKFLFEVGLGKEALGLGDADLMMMVGAFLGWQIVLIGFFAGAIAALAIKIPLMIADAVQKRSVSRELSFGPGLALGVMGTWLAWPWISHEARVLFEPIALGFLGICLVGGMFIAGLLLRKK
ncbi:MAG: prepilin peptidase [Fimbriiglobus sp.]